MDYPTKKQIDDADCVTAFEWYRTLPMPRTTYEYGRLGDLFEKVWNNCKERRHGV
jgi:hypothetical protein